MSDILDYFLASAMWWTLLALFAFIVLLLVVKIIGEFLNLIILIMDAIEEIKRCL